MITINKNPESLDKLSVVGDTVNGQFLTSVSNTGTQSEDNGLIVECATSNASSNVLKVQSTGNANTLIVKGNGAVGIGVSSGAITDQLTVGGTSKLVGLASFSNGISFGNETLQYYDLGTWTPLLYYQNGSGVTIGGTAYASQGASDYVTARGSYVKVGEMVHIQAFIKATVGGSIVNDNIGIQGLPFNAKNLSDANQVFTANSSTASITVAQISPNSTVAMFGAVNNTANLANEVGTGSNLHFFISGTYYVN